MPDFLTEYFSSLLESLLATLKTPDAYVNKIALTAIVLLMGLGLHIMIKKIITRSVSDATKRFKLKKAFKQMMGTLTIIFALFIWIQAINALILLALVFCVFVAFMVRGLTSNITGYYVIKYWKYFEVGHRVEINGVIGDVIEINPFGFELLEVRNQLSSDSNTGRIIKLPNSLIFNESIEMIGVKNDFVWHEIKYVLTFDSDWEAAEKIMVDAGASHFKESKLLNTKERSNHLPMDPEQLAPVFSVDTNEDGIVLVLRYLVDYRRGTSSKTALQRKILTAFNAHSQIEIAVVDIRILSK